MIDCKSQNTKNEQLTEQWKKGELPSGEYYIIDVLGLHTTDRYYPSHGFGAELPQAVLAPVPSYEEWQASEKYNKHLEEKIKIYERKDKQATETSIAYNKLAEENEELKLLLAEALSHFKASFPFLYRGWIDKADKFLGDDKCGKRK